MAAWHAAVVILVRFETQARKLPAFRLYSTFSLGASKLSKQKQKLSLNKIFSLFSPATAAAPVYKQRYKGNGDEGQASQYFGGARPLQNVLYLLLSFKLGYTK